MSANQAFLLATRHGGLALRRDDLGIIAKDAKADLLIWDASSPSLLAWRDPVAAIILHASIGDIEAVVVDGKFVKEGKKLVAPEFEQGRAQFDEVAERIQSIWAELPPVDLTPGVQWPPEFGQYLTGSTEVVDALRGEGDGYGDKFL
jgi:hypothetical protein